MRLWLLALVAPVAAQFGFFDQILQQHGQAQQQQQRQQAQRQAGVGHVEHLYHQVDCDRFLCEDTLACVDKPLDCPCPFENSQLKCVLPDNSKYVCISAPTDGSGPSCDFVERAWEDKV